MVPNNSFWERIYKEQAPRMLAICRRYVSSISIAEDIMHDAFIQAIDKHHTFKGSGSFEGWLSKITVNNALLYLRKSRGTETFPIEDYSSSHHEGANDNGIGQTSIKQVIESAQFTKEELIQSLDMLPAHHRTVFNMYVLDGFSHKEIGKLLGISMGTSKSHLARARKRLQAMLHQKALDMKRKDTRRRAIMVIPFLPFGAPFIDRFFRENLKHFTLVPTTSGLDLKIISSSPTSEATIGQVGSLSTPILASVIVTLAVGSIIALYHYNNATPSTIFESDSLMVYPDSSYSFMPKEDTVKVDALPIPKGSSAKHAVALDTISEQKAPVVIRRQVIVRDTVFKYVDNESSEN